MQGFPIIATGDIHGDIDALDEVLSLAEKLGAKGLLIAGDLCPKDPSLAIALHTAPFPYVAVKGNCDWLWDFRDAQLAIPRESTCIALPDGHHIGMAHGHTICTPQELPVPLTAGDIFILGHSHVPQLEVDGEGIIHLNPGSPSRPRGKEGATCAAIWADRIEIWSLKKGKAIRSMSRNPAK